VLVFVLVLSLYGLACVLPVILDERGPVAHSVPGWTCLLLGWHWPLCLPWSANLVLAGGLLSLARGRYRTASWAGGAAALLGLTSWAFVGKDLGIGYYFWQASLVLLAVGGYVISAGNSPFRPAAPGHRSAALGRKLF
jgi:hypothetical protein